MVDSLPCLGCGEPSLGAAAVCRSCALVAATLVLEGSHDVVAKFWDVDPNFEARRGHFAGRRAARRKDGVDTYGGLAVGYLDIGLKTDALLAAAVGISEGLPTTSCCSDPVGVLFDHRIFRHELLDEFVPTLASRALLSC
jgi:hypothetical protein